MTGHDWDNQARDEAVTPMSTPDYGNRCESVGYTVDSYQHGFGMKGGRNASHGSRYMIQISLV